MYRESYQHGLLTIFFSCGSKPLNIWDTYTRDGYITKLLDEDIKSTVIEIGGTNVSTTYMICPKGKMVLGITMPFLVMVVKNLKKYFSFEVTVLDDTKTRRRFRVSNFQSTTQILPLCTVMPIALSEGWNQIQFNMSDFCRRAYKKQFVEVQKFKINANIRIRRIYFADRILPDDQLPAEYKLFIPLKKTAFKSKPKTEEEIAEPQKEESAELKKRNSKSASASKITKSAQAIEKRPSKVTEGDEVFIKPPTEAVAMGEGSPDQSNVVAEVAVAPAKELGAVVESGPESAPEAKIIAAAEARTEKAPETKEATAETVDLVKETSVDGAVQTEGVVTVVDAPVEEVAT